MQITSWGGMTGKLASLAHPMFSSDMRSTLMSSRDNANSRCLIIGNLRSYGDEILSPGGHYVQTIRCDRILNIDSHTDAVTAECGIRLDVLQCRVAPFGYILPVTPGTAFVTLGGAIANDVHGKNHHRAGTFGCYVDKLELVRTSGEVLICSRTDNAEWFAGTVGGMGLTGAITWATIKLRRIASPMLRVSSQRFENLSEFFAIDLERKDHHEYTVAWIDCMASGRSLGRGIYSVADHMDSVGDSLTSIDGANRFRGQIPISLPVSPINRLTLSLMNSIYYRAHSTGSDTIHFKRWLYPLDAVNHWNRLYGRRGFYQFQCVIPSNNARSAIREVLETISRHKEGSFLAVLKNFGDVPSPGLMSFPMAGTTLALDFPNRGKATEELLLHLYRTTAAAGGRLYPAKDGCSPANSLEAGYSHFRQFKRLVDPGIESEMSRRLQLTI